MTKVSESMSQAASLASLGKEFSESFIKASNLAAVGNFHIHLEPTWLFFYLVQAWLRATISTT